MMQSNNVCTFIGRLVADPELKNTSAGVEYASFCIAVDRYAKKGEEKLTDFINCVAWRQTAVFVSNYFHKGSAISVLGSLQVRKYEDKNGQKRTAYDVVVEAVNFVGSKSDNAGSAPVDSAPSSASAAIDDDESYPF